jgi:hypothetical protein
MEVMFMKIYLMKNKTRAQINVSLMNSAPPDKILVIPPRAVRKADLTEDEYAYVLDNYPNEVNISPKA